MAHNLYKMSFSRIYEMYAEKVTKKGRTTDELDAVIFWLTGHNEITLKSMLDANVSVEEFFSTFPSINENAGLITGVVCGIRVEQISDRLMQKIRYLDKLVDELAKGKALDKILRK